MERLRRRLGWSGRGRSRPRRRPLGSCPTAVAGKWERSRRHRELIAFDPGLEDQLRTAMEERRESSAEEPRRSARD